MESTFTQIRAQMAWVFIYGPALSFLPERWRGGGINQKFALWGVVTAISGAGEMFVGVNLIGIWYAFQLSPVLLWASAYFLADGAWRIANSRSRGENAGSVLLVFMDQAIYAARQVAWKVAHPAVSDVTELDDAREDWQLKIEAARTKPKWEAGKIVLHGERYFRIESCIQVSGPRPYIYLMKSLPAGVPSHAVLKYTPVEIFQKPN
jgi:hypothetical protein